MKVHTFFDETGSSSSFCRMVSQISGDDRFKSLMILSCDANNLDNSQIRACLMNCSMKVFGGVFPAVIYKGRKFEKGTIFLAFHSDCRVISIKDDESPEEILEREYKNLETYNTAFVFVDGMSLNISPLLDTVFDILGLEFNYIGGGAGSLSFTPKPCVFLQDGLHQRTSTLVFFKMYSGIGVAHGWSELEGPFLVTGSRDNTILSLDMKPAMDIYSRIVEKYTGIVLTEDNFYFLAKSFPFGITKLGSENIIRDPLRFNSDGSITCVGNIPSQGFMHIMTGTSGSLKDAARQSLEEAEKNLVSRPENRILFHMECISRALFLGDEFNDVLNQIQEREVNYTGALVLGEIANSRKDYLEFHNKSSVIGLWEN